MDLEIRRLTQFQGLEREDLEVIAQWIRSVEFSGPYELLLNGNVWNDHALLGSWKGYRSSSFSHKGRIIYRISKESRTVLIAKITVSHDYRRI